MDNVKEAFQRVREDISFLNYELSSLKDDVYNLRDEMVNLIEVFQEVSKNINDSDRQTDKQTNQQINTKDEISPDPAHDTSNSTLSTHDPTLSTNIKPLKPQFLGISRGNEGVPTDRQTDKQTNQQTQINLKSSYNQEKNTFQDAANFLDSLDNLKKDLRLKFKRLTEQELMVFSTIYQLTDDGSFTDYREISQKLKLSESSIRDYIGRLLKKGVPVDKKRINNKNISLSISPDLKKVASLQTILQLRDS